MTVEEILADLGVTLDPAKADSAKKWNGQLSTLETGSAQKLADAQKALQDAQALQRVIDDNIAANGLTEANMAQLRANNAALSAALEEVKKAGFTGINIPNLPPANPTKDPMKELESLIVKGFTNVGQTLNIANRYQRVFGHPMPDDPGTLADEAAARRMDVVAYAEQKYGFAAAEQKAQQEATAKREAEIRAAAVAEYKEKNPNTAGHPELNPGMPSNYPAIPKPRDGASVREMAGMTTRQKIEAAMKHAVTDVNSRASA
jgi:hypothetical protein